MKFPLLASLLLPAVALAQLPPVPVPQENPLTPAKIVLGKALFWEEQLSHDNTVACGTCHLPETGGTDPRLTLASTRVHPGPDGLYGTADDIHGSPGKVNHDVTGAFSPSTTFGFGVQVTGRIASHNLGAAYHTDLFWDGRATSTFTDPETGLVAIAFGGALESQAIAPILSSVEMGKEGRTWNDVRTKLTSVRPLRLATAIPPDVAAALQQNPTYPALFLAAFGSSTIDARGIAFAIASYQRTLIPDQTPWDSFMAGNTNALTPGQQAGAALFQGNGRCTLCHFPPLFSDDQFHNLGNRPWQEDPGEMNVSGLPIMRGTFKTPSLRNMGLRPRGFHNGSMPALGQNSQTDPDSMVNFYFNGGGPFPENLDPFVLNLSQSGVVMADMLAIEDFVQNGLTDPRAAAGLPPFDHPSLRTQLVPPPRIFGQGLAGASEPFLVDTAPTFLGNSEFQIGVVGGQPGGGALLAYALSSSEPAILFGTMPINLGSTMGWNLLALQGTSGAGYATSGFPIPADPALANLSVFFQLFTTDSATSGGVSTSKGWQFTVR